MRKWWTLSFNAFISLSLTSTFTLDESELYNPLAGFRGQQQRVPEGRENHSPAGKKIWHPIFNLIYQCKAKIDSVSLLSRELSWRDVSKSPHFDLAQWINTTLYCFNLRSIDFSMLTLYKGTFIIRQAYSMIKQATVGSDLLILHPDHMTAEQPFSSLGQIITL